MDFEDAPIFIKIKRNKKRWWFRKGEMYEVEADTIIHDGLECYLVKSGPRAGSAIPVYCTRIIPAPDENNPEGVAEYLVQNIQQGLTSDEPYVQRISLFMAAMLKREISGQTAIAPYMGF